MALTVPLPFNPGSLEYNGGQVNLGALNQLITALSGSASPSYGNWLPTTQAGGATVSLTAANMLGGIFSHTGSAGATAVTTATAAALAAAWPGLQVGATSPFVYVNLNNATDTVAGGSGVTMTAGSASSPFTVVTNAARFFTLQCTAAPVNIIGLGWNNGVATVTTNLPHGLAAGNSAIIANTTNAAFNATWTVATVLNAYQFTFAITQAQIITASGSPSVSNAIVPGPSVTQPALLNTAPTFTCSSWFAWPATMIA